MKAEMVNCNVTQLQKILHNTQVTFKSSWLAFSKLCAPLQVWHRKDPTGQRSNTKSVRRVDSKSFFVKFYLTCWRPMSTTSWLVVQEEGRFGVLCSVSETSWVCLVSWLCWTNSDGSNFLIRSSPVWRQSVTRENSWGLSVFTNSVAKWDR